MLLVTDYNSIQNLYIFNFITKLEVKYYPTKLIGHGVLAP